MVAALIVHRVEDRRAKPRQRGAAADRSPRRSICLRCCRRSWQTCSLLYRRFVTCGSSAKSRGLGVPDAWPITNRRYGRLKICATVTDTRRKPWGFNLCSRDQAQHATGPEATAGSLALRVDSRRVRPGILRSGQVSLTPRCGVRGRSTIPGWRARCCPALPCAG